jgi:hypothetical protein
MIPALILGGVAATYLHKKFPKATEAVASGIVKSTAWVARKTAKMITEHYADHQLDGTKKCCVECFASRPGAMFCVSCGGKKPDGKVINLQDIV